MKEEYRMFDCEIKDGEQTGCAVIAKTHNKAKTAYFHSELFSPVFDDYTDIRCKLTKTQPKNMVEKYGTGIINGWEEGVSLVREGVYAALAFCPLCEDERYSPLQDDGDVHCGCKYEN